MASFQSRRSLLPAFFLLALLLLAFGRMEKAEARRICASPSKRFKGSCFSHDICANICHREGFTSGGCHVSQRQCICLKLCPAEN